MLTLFYLDRHEQTWNNIKSLCNQLLL